MHKKSIFFGFYKGLGDFISDSYIIEYFYQNNYEVSIAVSSWLKEITKFLFPNAEVLSYKEGKEILNWKYSYDYIFLSPNYLHPVNINHKSLLLYLVKYRAVKKNTNSSSIIIKPTYGELFNYYFNLKKTYLNEHFYYMSYKLLKKFFPEIPDKKQNNSNSNTIPLIKNVYIFPFSGFKPKDYPVDRYYKIAKYIKQNYDLSPVFFVVPKDVKKLENIKSEFEVESKSLTELAKIFDENSLVICSDSGPGHLAAKFGANLIILYSTTKPEKYKPIGNGKIFTIKSKTKNITDISTENIIEKIEKFRFEVKK